MSQKTERREFGEAGQGYGVNIWGTEFCGGFLKLLKSHL